MARVYCWREAGGGDCGTGPWAIAARADRVDYWIRRHVVPCPTHVKVNPALQRRVALTAVGQCLKEQYDAAKTPVPAHLAALVEQLKIDPHLRVSQGHLRRKMEQ